MRKRRRRPLRCCIGTNALVSGDRRRGDTRRADLVLLDSDAAAGVDASICRRATVSSFAEDRLDAGRASGAPAAAPQNWYQRGAAMWRGSSTPQGASGDGRRDCCSVTDGAVRQPGPRPSAARPGVSVARRFETLVYTRKQSPGAAIAESRCELLWCSSSWATVASAVSRWSRSGE
jgi:hypothetical protein